MNRTIFYLGTVVFLALGLSYYLATRPEHTVPPGKTALRRVSFSLILTNTGGDVLPKAELWVNGPNKQAGMQVCDEIKADHQFRNEIDEHNNQILHFTFENLPPYGKKIINIEAVLSLKASLAKSTLTDSRQYLGKEPYIEISDARIISQAQQLHAESREKTAENIYQFVEKSVTRATYSKDEKGALYALLRKKGDCTEFMHLVIALCRVNAIPARAVSGYIASGDQRISPDALHDWAEAYLNGKWRVIDPFFNIFMEHEDQYLVMQLHDKRLNPKPYERWRTSSPNLQVTMVQ